MGDFWSIWIVVLTVITLIGVLWLLLANRKTSSKGEDQKTGHEYDGIEEYDNPLPAWWMNMFLVTILFAVAYLITYPGLGSFKGMLGWTQVKQYEKEVARAEERFLAVYDGFKDKSVEGLATDSKAVKMGQRLFSNNCSVCHGSDAGGTTGYPNLRDNDWLWGGSGAAIKQSITHGRGGVMPAWKVPLGEEKVKQVANYVMAMSVGQAKSADSGDMNKGKQVFGTYCVACHGANGQGNTALGAPALNDSIWLYGGTLPAVTSSIANGRNGQMPAHSELLTEERIQLIAAYVYSLSQPDHK